METTGISRADFTRADVESLLKLIETIRAEKSTPAEAAPAAPAAASFATAENATPTPAPTENQPDGLPTLGRYVNIWA